MADVDKKPSNTAAVLLVVFIVIFLLVIFVVLIFAALRDSQDPAGATTILPPCNQSVDTSTLVVIPPDASPCYINGVLTDTYYLGLFNPAYPYVVAPIGTNPLNVCIQYCQTFDSATQTCNGTPVGDVSAQINYNNCMTQLSSTTCAVPLPLGIAGSTLYYAQSPTDALCGGPLPYN